MIHREERLASELEALEIIESVQYRQPHMIELVEPSSIIILGGDRLAPSKMRDMLAEFDYGQYQHVLVILEDLILDLGNTPIMAHSDGHSVDNLRSIAEHVNSVLIGASSPVELSFESEAALRQLQEAGLLSFQTPAAAAELLINWTISNDTESVLNPGHGTGQFLIKILERFEHGEESSGPTLIGIDTSEIACQIAKVRLGDDATILNRDFLEFGTDGGHPTLPDFDQSSNEEDYSDSRELSTVEGEGQTAVDAVISHLPTVRLGQLPQSLREQLRDRFGHSRLDQAFVLHSLSMLRRGGSGAFLMPQSSLTDTFVEGLRSQARIHGLVRLSSSEFLTQGIEPVLLFLEKLETDQDSSEPIRVLRIDTPEITDLHKSLLHGPVEGAIERSEDLDDVSMASVSPSNLDPDLLPLALSGPRASSFIFSESFNELSDVASPHTGLTTGNNEFFYFDQEEVDGSGIPRSFFIPVLRKLARETRRVTLDEIDQYLLDLRDLTAEARADIEDNPTITDFLNWLKRQDQPELVEYLSDHKSTNPRFGEAGLNSLIPQDLTERVWNPEMVAPWIFDQPQWLLVDIDDDIVFDTTMVGLVTDNEVPAEALWTLLNTPLYKRLQSDSSPPLHNDASYSRFLIRDLRSLPIISSCLTNEFAQDVGPMIPTDNPHEEIEIQNRIIEACDQDERGAVDSAFEAFSQDALSWFLSGRELRELSNRIENEQNPEEFLIDQFGEAVLDDIERMYSRVGLFEGRKEVLLDLIELFDSEHYQTFLVGLAPQFEGILVDYIQATGGRVDTDTREVEENGEITEIEVYVFYPSGSQQGKRKDLKRLFDEFFEGEYLRFLQDKVRERRNELAHGTIVEEPDRLAVLLFVAFFAMTNSILHSFNRHLAQIEN